MKEKKKKEERKKKAETQKESKYINSKDIERKQKRGTDRENNIKQRAQVCIWDFISPLLLKISVSLILKSEFLFGKTNKVGFHEEFLTPCMKLYIRVLDS